MNEKVVSALDEMNIACAIRYLDRETRTAQQAAETLGCDILQIVKSLVFKSESGRPVLAATSGGNRVDLNRLSKIIGENVGKADAKFVRSQTGFVIGGVAPVGLPAYVQTVFDIDLFNHDVVWAAAGTANTLFPISKADLYRLADGRIYDFAELSV